MPAQSLAPHPIAARPASGDTVASLRVAPMHGFQGRAPVSASVVAFNRERTGRIKYTVCVRFEGQEWRVFKYYTDFLRLRYGLECSQYNAVAANLPPKHPLRLKLRMKLSLTKRRGMRKEMAFIKYRMTRLELWLNNLLEHVGPLGLYNVKFLDDFFEAFPDDESYMRSSQRAAHAKVECSMFHALKSMSVPDDVYTRLWASGYCYDSLATLTTSQWLGFGVSHVLSNALFRKFRKQRRAASTSSIDVALASAAAMLPQASPQSTPAPGLAASAIASTHGAAAAASTVPPPYSAAAALQRKRSQSAMPSAPPIPCRSRKPSTSSLSADAGPHRGLHRSATLPTIEGSPPNAAMTVVRERQQRALEACALLGRRASVATQPQ